MKGLILLALIVTVGMALWGSAAGASSGGPLARSAVSNQHIARSAASDISKARLAGVPAKGSYAFLLKLGVEPTDAMEPFVRPFDAFHHQTAPSDWLEGLIKAYVGDGLASDFYREVAAFLDAQTRTIVVTSLSDVGHSEFVIERVRQAIAEDHRVAGALALWGRRLMGEALSQAQRVAAERDSLAALLAGGVDRPGLDLAALGRMFSRLTENHANRMAELGLAS